MSCCNHSKITDALKPSVAFTIRPDEPCIFCAEKHVSDAKALAVEFGYRQINRQMIIGSLGCAIWHLAEEYPTLAAEVRAARLEIQMNHWPKVAWSPLLAHINAAADKERKG